MLDFPLVTSAADTNASACLQSSSCILQVEQRFQMRQAIKSAGFVTNRRQEQRVASAVMAAQQIPDSFVKLAESPEGPAQVTSMQDPTHSYEVTHAGTDTARCTCPQGRLHYMCKHVVKVIALSQRVSGAEIILALGTRAGTSQQGLSNLYNSTVGQHQTKPDDLAELHSTFQLECDELLLKHETVMCRSPHFTK